MWFVLVLLMGRTTVGVFLRDMVRLILAVCDLVEAEGRVLREVTIRTFLVCIFLLLVMLFLCCGLFLLVMAAYIVLRGMFPEYEVYLLLATLCLCIAVVFFAISRKILLKREPTLDGRTIEKHMG